MAEDHSTQPTAAGTQGRLPSENEIWAREIHDDVYDALRSCETYDIAQGDPDSVRVAHSLADALRVHLEGLAGRSPEQVTRGKPDLRASVSGETPDHTDDGGEPDEPPFEFGAEITDEQRRAMEEHAASDAVAEARRLSLTVMSRGSEHARRLAVESPEAHMELLEAVSGYREHLEGALEYAKAAEFRLRSAAPATSAGAS